MDDGRGAGYRDGAASWTSGEIYRPSAGKVQTADSGSPRPLETLRHTTTTSPRRIDEIVAAALHLTHFEDRYLPQFAEVTRYPDRRRRAGGVGAGPQLVAGVRRRGKRLP